AAASAPVPDAPEAPVVLGAPALSLREVSVRYGGVVAVDNLSFDVPEGAIVGLIGPNGAGKTTVIDAISGFARTSGEVVLGSEKLTGLRSHKRIRSGLGRTFQAIELYEDLSVRENVVVGLSGRGRSLRVDERDLDEIFETLGLTDVCEVPAGEL
ncbi:ATP-binding cassette domain-containing protein, partial [Streptomyces sp. SID10244]|nr:ATP-binding cassette domain-containing protein [Streptomyces sp. SID10244]